MRFDEMAKLSLPTVTLCAATSVNLSATLEALRASLDQVNFADCILFTDAEIASEHRGIRIVRIDRLETSSDYSKFMIRSLGEHITTPHCLVVQWDGFVINPSQWDPDFLNYDFIGAPWPQFGDGFGVGNGGFSLRSRALLGACRDESFIFRHPEDLAICRLNRPLLEDQYQIRFANREVASRFAYERDAAGTSTFGFHGVFNMIPEIGADRFWQKYLSLDNPSTAFVDFWTLFRQLGAGGAATKRRFRLMTDRVTNLFGR